MKRLIPLLLPFIAACAGIPDVSSRLTPYRIDVRQGNYFTQEMLAQLQPGQTKDQVRFILGTPLIADIFHAERWDYVYYLKPGHGEAQERHMTVFFSNGKLTRVSGDVVAKATSASQPKMQLIDIGAAPAPAAGAGK